jgi:predicted esterase
MTISRRSVLAVGVGAAAGLALPAAAQAGGRQPAGTGFVLHAETLDGGEQVTSLTLDTSRLGPIDPASLSTGTFSVHARATSPVPVAPGVPVFGLYDLDRTVIGARLDRRGNIVLELNYGEGVAGGATVGFHLGIGRNVRFDLTYTIIQNSPLLVCGRPTVIESFVQGRVANPEVDTFSYHTSASGLKYRLHPSSNRGRRPLIVWLHGGGEGGSPTAGYYDNETTLRGNRGALGFATAAAQRIFGGAHVVAPQSDAQWSDDSPRSARLIHEVIDEVARRHAVDRDRIYVAGCSNGGYMTLKITTVYPRLFAASVPACGIVTVTRAGATDIPDADLRKITTPTWLIASRDDTVVDPTANTVHAHDVVPGSLMTLYDHVIWNGHQFSGHSAWIYVGRNDPSVGGTHLWQWMARHRR